MKTLLIIILTIIAISSANSQWFQQTSGTTQTLYSVSGSIGGSIWACGDGGVVLRTSNWGLNWTSVGGAAFSTLPLYNIISIYENKALVTGSNGTGTYVYKTTNGGNNWTQVFFQAGGFINVIDIAEFGGDGFMQGDPVGGRWSLWKTTNEGTTWDSSGMYLPQSGSEAGWNNSLFGFASSGDYWFGTNNSRIYKTTNFGSSWEFTPTPEVNSYTVWFNLWYGLSGGSQLMRTTNSGLNWQNQTAPGTGNISSAVGTKDVFWFVRQGSSIYFSPNNGALWNTDIDVAGAQFTDMAIVLVAPFDNTASGGYNIYAVGTGGRIYVRDYSSSLNPISSNVPERYSLSQNYPNPFNPSSKIKFDITKADFVSLKVYNSLGQEVSKLVNENLTPGTYEVTFDGAGLNSGIYFYTIQSGDFVETKKMMLVK